jgi:hypothetical protein
MKDHARHVPGSTRSCRTALSRSAILPRLTLVPRKSTYKIQTTCRQNRECDFTSDSARIAYNFNTLKRLHSAARFPLPRAAETKSLAAHGTSLGQGEGQTGSLWCSDPRQPILAALPVFVPLLLTRPSAMPQPELTILDKMRLFETETDCHRGIFRTNRETFLRLVSFCTVLVGESRVAAIQNPKWTVLGQNRTKSNKIE